MNTKVIDILQISTFIAILIGVPTGAFFAGADAGIKRHQKELYPELCPECQQKLMKQIVEEL